MGTPDAIGLLKSTASRTFSRLVVDTMTAPYLQPWFRCVGAGVEYRSWLPEVELFFLPTFYIMHVSKLNVPTNYYCHPIHVSSIFLPLTNNQTNYDNSDIFSFISTLLNIIYIFLYWLLVRPLVTSLRMTWLIGCINPLQNGKSLGFINTGRFKLSL